MLGEDGEDGEDDEDDEDEDEDEDEEMPMYRTQKGAHNNASIVYLTPIGVVASGLKIAVDLEVPNGPQKSMIFGLIVPTAAILESPSVAGPSIDRKN